MGGKSERGKTQNLPEPTVNGLPENNKIGPGYAWELHCVITSKEARLNLFKSMLDGEDIDSQKKTYLKHAGLISFIRLKPKALISWYQDADRKAKWGKKEKTETLRRFELDLEVAQRFLKVGLLRDLLDIEQEELNSLIFNPAIYLSGTGSLNPEFKKLVEKLKTMEAAGLPNKTIDEINRLTIINVGQVYVSGENSVWIVDHYYFGADCRGRVNLVAQKEDGDIFRSTGNSCSACEQSLPELINISFPKSRLEKKIHDDSLKEKIPDYKS